MAPEQPLKRLNANACRKLAPAVLDGAPDTEVTALRDQLHEVARLILAADSEINLREGFKSMQLQELVESLNPSDESLERMLLERYGLKVKIADLSAHEENKSAQELWEESEQWMDEGA